ncbi:hypothetical protein KAF25_005108 [Fusarium avenaceum]|uniref:Uncharacterized protein n=1 Tax=Fusarium avenaceum TaxID=40199 RepID=A0A9P7H7C2_9HYPO|nr:hypothetical protein KAF25_005108 [Fusarium avenaceum]
MPEGIDGLSGYLHITQYRPLEIVKRLVVIVGDLVLEMAKNTVVKTLGVVKNLTNAVIEELNKPISIPIISPLYKSIAGDELSIMSCVLLQQLPRLLFTKLSLEATHFLTTPRRTPVYKTLTIMVEFAAVASLGSSVIANVIKIPWMIEGKPDEISVIQPRPSHGSWEIQMDAVVTDLAFLKTRLDTTSVGEQEMDKKDKRESSRLVLRSVFLLILIIHSSFNSTLVTSPNTAKMVNFVTSVAVLLTAVSSAVAIPYTLQERQSDTTCMDHLPASSLARVSEAVECINYLASLNQACVAGVSGVSFCRRGNTQITGLARNLPSHLTSSSSCKDVARGAGLIMDRCTRGDGTVRGQNPAWGNGNLWVDIRSVR